MGLWCDDVDFWVWCLGGFCGAVFSLVRVGGLDDGRSFEGGGVGLMVLYGGVLGCFSDGD